MSITAMFDKLEDTVDVNNTWYMSWTAKGVGFGGFAFYTGPDGKPHCENERMGKEFIRKMLNKLVDDLVLDDPKDE